MDEPCSLLEFIDFIRETQRIPRSKEVLESSYLEKDLGITGDDGCELLEEIERRFKVSFNPTVLGLRDGQYLFHSEGGKILQLIASVLGRDFENVKSITVGELYRATCRAFET